MSSPAYGDFGHTSIIIQTTPSLIKDLSLPPVSGRSPRLALGSPSHQQLSPNQSLSVLYRYFVKTRKGTAPAQQ